MDREALRARQTPLKARYRTAPEAAVVALRAEGTLRPQAVGCDIATWAGPVTAGLHPATGGAGDLACSGEMLLQALVGCAGVTLSAVSLAMGIPVRGGRITAQAHWDARGTLAVSSEAAVGITQIQLAVELETDATDGQLAKLLELTERYCVVLQTLVHSATMTARVTRTPAGPASAFHDKEQST
ncbi:MAG: OsmC family protein [Gemmatimonadota bacterium]|nr:OsmC family protein [Gemmatimonadota bacterium]